MSLLLEESRALNGFIFTVLCFEMSAVNKPLVHGFLSHLLMHSLFKQFFALIRKNPVESSQEIRRKRVGGMDCLALSHAFSF